MWNVVAHDTSEKRYYVINSPYSYRATPAHIHITLAHTCTAHTEPVERTCFVYLLGWIKMVSPVWIFHCFLESQEFWQIFVDFVYNFRWFFKHCCHSNETHWQLDSRASQLDSSTLTLDIFIRDYWIFDWIAASSYRTRLNWGFKRSVVSRITLIIVPMWSSICALHTFVVSFVHSLVHSIRDGRIHKNHYPE